MNKKYKITMYKITILIILTIILHHPLNGLKLKKDDITIKLYKFLNQTKNLIILNYFFYL